MLLVCNKTIKILRKFNSTHWLRFRKSFIIASDTNTMIHPMNKGQVEYYA